MSEAVVERPPSVLLRVWRHPVLGPAVKVVALYILIFELLLQMFIGRLDLGLFAIGPGAQAVPRGSYLFGALTGTLYALIGMGIILVYRANRIINFAQAQLGAVPATMALLLLARGQVPYLVALAIVLVGGALLGGAVEVGFIRRFRRSSRLILTVVTIGVGFVLFVAEFYVKVWLGGDLQVVEFPTPFTAFSFRLGFVTLTGDHLFTVAVAVSLVAALAAILRFTDIGIAIRATAENTDRASLLGIPVLRVSTVVWILAGTLSAIGVFLRAPIIGLPLTGFVGPAILLLGLTTAVIARMEKLSTALVAGMFIGAVEHATLVATGRAAIADIAMLAFILVALLTQRDRFARAQEQAAAAWQFVRDIRPIPSQLRELREVVWVRRLVLAATAGAALAAPFLIGDRTGTATQGLVFAMVGISLVILTGWAGQISLGQFGFAGVGAAVAGGLAANHGMDFFLTLLLAGLAGAFIAVLVGLPALRIQGLLLAVTTLAFAFAVRNFVLTREFFGWLLPQDFAFVERPNLYGRLDLASPSGLGGLVISSDAKLYWVVLGFLLLAIASARSLRRLRSGRVLIAARDHPRLVQAFGVSPASTRLAAFAISGFIAAIAGALFAYEQGAVDPGSYDPAISIQLFLMTVIGGIGSVMGALLGAAFVVGVPLLPVLRDIPLIEFLTSGFGLLLILYFLPGGLSDGVGKVRDTYLRWVAKRRGIHVPSLVADSLTEEAEDDDDVVLSDAQRHLLETDAAPADAIACPACAALVPLADAVSHDCFVAARLRGAQVPANGNGSTPGNPAKGVRR